MSTINTNGVMVYFFALKCPFLKIVLCLKCWQYNICLLNSKYNIDFSILLVHILEMFLNWIADHYIFCYLKCAMLQFFHIMVMLQTTICTVIDKFPVFVGVAWYFWYEKNFNVSMSMSYGHHWTTALGITDDPPWWLVQTWGQHFIFYVVLTFSSS